MESFKFIVGLFFALVILNFSGVVVKADTQEMLVCGGSRGSFKSYMPMTALSKQSPQYKYLIESTVQKDNLRVTEDGYIAVAMGSYYGVLGDKFIITFDNGQQTKVVKVDEKSDAHTSAECYGMSMKKDGSIVEAITHCSTKSVESCSNPSKFKEANFHGNIGVVYQEFAGESKIKKIEKINGSDTSRKGTIEGDTSLSTMKEPSGKAEEPSSSLEEGLILAYYIPKVFGNRLVFVDTEFTENKGLVQAAFIILERVDDNNHFFLTSSLNVYVNTKLTSGFEAYTGIKEGFLGNEGVTPYEACEIINEYIDEMNINSDDSLVIGHGLKQDLIVLKSFGCNVTARRYDTLNAGKKYLNRDKNLKLSDLLLDAGFVQGDAHDAYQDARNLIPIFAHLKRIEEEFEESN